MKSSEEVYKAYINRHELVSGGVVTPHWTADGNGLWFVAGAPQNTVILRIDLNTGETSSMFDVAAIRSSLAAATGYEAPHRGLPFESFTPLPDGGLTFHYAGSRWRLDPSTHGVQRMEGVDSFSGALGWTPQSEPSARTWKRYDYLSMTLDVLERRSPDGEWFASIRNHNLLLRLAHSGAALDRQVTLDGTAECFWDIEALRFKILSGKRITFRAVDPWSPDSLTLLAYRRNIAGVFRMPRLDWLGPFEQVEFLPFHKVGTRLDRIEPAFVDVRSGRIVFVQLPEIEDRYIQLLCWHPDGTQALLAVYTRDLQRVEIYASHRETGAVRRLLTESAATFVKVQHEAIFSGEHGFRLLPDGSGFLWLSTRNGWNHLYHYNMSGALVRQLTVGEWPVYEIEHVGTDGFVYMTAAIDRSRPYDVHVCRVALEGGALEQLTRETGIHAPLFSPNGQVFLDTHSTVDRPTRTDLLKADGTLLRTISQMDISRLKALGYTPAEEFTVKAADGVTDLWGVLYKPFNFDRSRSYPVIEYIYGGPQAIETPRFFAVDESMLTTVRIPWALAHLGYIVVCLDARGTPGRSKAFHDAVCGDFTVGVPDHAAAIQQLCERNPWMDARRVGIMGHSWGGYFSTCALMQAPDTYHAAVSSAPSYDPWEAIYYEPYLNLPLKNRAPYEKADLIRQASKVKGRLMIVVGTSDHFILASAMKMTRALIERGVDHDFVAVPQGFHQFSGVEEDYFLMKLTSWFERHVKHRLTA